MNRYSLTIDYDANAGLVEAPDALFADSRLVIRSENLHPPLRVHRQDDRFVFMVGNPIAQDRRDDKAVLDVLGAAADDASFAAALNGSFLILLYDPASGALVIGNDRFASLALYHVCDRGRLSLALSAKQLMEARRTQGALEVDEAALFEFLYFRRLFGEKTFDPQIRYLASASLLRIGPGMAEPRVETYWRPDYEAEPPSGHALVGELADRLRHAVNMHASEPRRFALLLSGGLDSRAILAAMRPAPLCITTALARNNEVEVAEQAARAAAAQHRFVARPANLYDGKLDDAVFLTGGMQVYSEAQFIGYGATLAALADSFLIGLGFDIFFGGLYLPKDTATLMGRPALHHRLRPLSSDLASDFTAGVKYRLRSSDPFTVVKAGKAAWLRDALRSSVEDIFARGRKLGAEGYDLWEYMHLHTLSRHYSFPMMASLRTFADCRAPALENGLFDLAIAMTAEQKLDGTAYQRAIAKLNPAVMRVRNANTNLRADWPLRRQTLVKAVRMAGNRLFGSSYPVSPGWRDRSWPAPKESLAANAGVYAAARALPRSERLADLSFLDMDAVGRVVAEHDSGRQDHAILLNLLLTIDRVLDGPRPHGDAMDGGRVAPELAADAEKTRLSLGR